MKIKIMQRYEDDSPERLLMTDLTIKDGDGRDITKLATRPYANEDGSINAAALYLLIRTPQFADEHSKDNEYNQEMAKRTVYLSRFDMTRDNDCEPFKWEELNYSSQGIKPLHYAFISSEKSPVEETLDKLAWRAISSRLLNAKALPILYNRLPKDSQEA